jgi:hypothetical protein
MHKVSRQCKLVALLLAIPLLGGRLQAGSFWDDDYNREDYEEPAGPSFAFLLNPADDIWGISVGAGTWLTGTPIFGDYFARLFHNGIEEATYSGLGMTLRLMPHSTVAPFVGAGGSYNYSLTTVESHTGDTTLVVHGKNYSAVGKSYWGGHVETGVRVWFSSRLQLLEVMGRYTWSGNEGDRDYWLVGISTGVGI